MGLSSFVGQAMSEQSEIHAMLSEVRTDVRWIKDSLKRGTERLDKHDRRIGRLETWRTWSTAVGTTIAGLLGVGHLPKF